MMGRDEEPGKHVFGDRVGAEGPDVAATENGFVDAALCLRR